MRRVLLGVGAHLLALALHLGLPLGVLAVELGPQVVQRRVGLRPRLLELRGAGGDDPARLLAGRLQGRFRVGAQLRGVLLHLRDLGVQRGPPLPAGLLLLVPARCKRDLEVAGRLVGLGARLGQHPFGLGPLRGDLVGCPGPDRPAPRPA